MKRARSAKSSGSNKCGAHILDAALAAGIDAPYGCRVGTCKTCAVKVLDGEPEHRDSALTPAERDRHRLICPCVSRAKSDRLVLDL